MKVKDHVALRELLCRAVVHLSLIHPTSISDRSSSSMSIVGCQGGNAQIHWRLVIFNNQDGNLTGKV